VVEPDDGPTAFEVIEQAIVDNHTSQAVWIASAVLRALSDAGFTVSR
jgi:hypothetical protein